jgi:5-methylcytosine-specific restriction endonuclease McrA
MAPLISLAKPKPRVITQRQKAMERDRQYRQATAFVRKRDGGTCRVCRKPGSQAHHIVYRSHGGTDEPSNLILTCHECHRLIHAHVVLVSYDQKHPAKSITFTRNTQWDERT